MRGLKTVVLFYLLLACAKTANSDSLDVRVRGIQGPLDSIHLKLDGRRSLRAVKPGPSLPAPVGDFEEMLTDLRKRNRKSLLTLKRDVDAMNLALETGSVSAGETRLLLADIRMRRIDARASLNLMGFMNRLVKDRDLAGRWGDPVHLVMPAPATPNILVVNRTRGQMAADVWDADTIRVGYIPAFSGWVKEDMPNDEALERAANVKAEVSVHSAAAVAAAIEGLNGGQGGGISGAMTVVTVSDPTGVHAPPGAATKDPPARGVLVFPSAMVPRPDRLLLDRADPLRFGPWRASGLSISPTATPSWRA